MKPALLTAATAFVLIPLFLSSSAQERNTLPPPAAHAVDFTTEIKPILETSCVKCHGKGKHNGGFRLDTRELLLSPADSGPAVLPGNSAQSRLIHLVAGTDPENVMPEKGSKLTASQVSLLRAWIDQGAPWPPNVAFSKQIPLNLHPRTPAVPPAPQGTPLSNPIDLFLGLSKGFTNSLASTPPVDDRTFARRAYLDVIGLLPTPKQLQRFLNDPRPGKRSFLVTELLNNKRDYAEHWLSFWNDALRNDYRGTGYIDGGRKQISKWLYSALHDNMPYDAFVRELVNPPPAAEGFVKGIVWRGVVNASQTPPMQAAQNISQVFMGINLKCASCHDSFINDWTLADAYGLASVYSETDLELVHCDKPTGKQAETRFIYPELGPIPSGLSKSERLRKLADILTGEKNGRLARTIVNRLWARFMGYGLVEPVDEMENPSWNPDLLDWLAHDLVVHEFDLKHTIHRILTSRAYQLPAVPLTERRPAPFQFQGPYVRRLSAEQFLDSFGVIANAWHESPSPQLESIPLASPIHDLAAEPSSGPNTLRRAQWIWNTRQAKEKAAAEAVFWRKTFHLPLLPTSAILLITCDNRFQLFLNGEELASGNDHAKPVALNIQKGCKVGQNTLAIRTVNDPGQPSNPALDQSNPAGLFVYVRLRHEQFINESPVEKVFDFASDNSWRWSREEQTNWTAPDFTDSHWLSAIELGEINSSPWNLRSALEAKLAAAISPAITRSSLVNLDPLLAALGRPNREQVVTTRASAATTLQALELTNGALLAQKIQKAASNLSAIPVAASANAIETIFQRVLLRPPTPPELQTLQQSLNSPLQTPDVEDLLWALVMLPEFQLIH